MLLRSVLRNGTTPALIALASVLALAADLSSGQAQTTPRLDVPYVPTPQEVVDRMLEMAQVGPNDYLVDLGSGDGRIPITAAKRFGTRGFGVDLNPVRVKEAIANAKEAGVSDKVRFVEGDLFKTDFSQATVLTLYLLPTVNLRLRPVILDTLKPGTRVVSHAFNMGEWKPDRSDVVENKDIYLWIVPAKVAGTWRVSDMQGGGRTFALQLNQEFQELSGSAAIGGKNLPVHNGRLEGERIFFEVAVDGQSRRYEGRVSNGRMEGEGWKASKG
ncbi:MAG TPA: methyltransferase domain-containing protein [Hyphomicrobiaceae bacterium]|nr:methyltransferase domain-containing protein [Hyphomicrobiaceae bacterium]